jgi:hypothetical protein
MRIQIPNFLIILAAGFLTVFSYSGGLAQDRKTAVGSTTMREPNVATPELYADRLKLKITLTSLPGADDPASALDGSYQIYFIPENQYYSVLDNLAGGGQTLRPSQFPRKILLAEGSIKKTSLSTLPERTFWRDNIGFKERIPERERTKFARLLINYSVKIYDARLKLPLYQSGVFLTYVFERPPAKLSARQTLYVKFSVTPQGTLSYSQLP